MSDNRIIIIGGGISGLTVAWELARRGREVVLLERRDVLGGLARSVPLNGKPLEVYYHFICGGDRHLVELARELGLSDGLHWHPGRTSYFVNGQLYPFTTPLDLLRFSPLSLTGRLRFGLHALRCRRLTDWRRLEHLSAEQWLLDSVGRQAYEVIWRPLLEVKFGRHHDKISAPWIWHRIHRYSQSRSSLLRPEQFGYLEGGSHALLTALQGSITAQGGLVHTGVEAFSLNCSGQRIEGVETSEGYYEADRVVAAVPLPELVRLLPGDNEYGRRLSQIQFTSVACVRLALRHSLT
ncbi:MAG: FAD-dependent oxidoreductase, partial [Armatimonadetes bacterium]|nr:FAD-dependent oxidoreductase [Armatimonadota bacterium]